MPARLLQLRAQLRIGRRRARQPQQRAAVRRQAAPQQRWRAAAA